TIGSLTEPISPMIRLTTRKQGLRWKSHAGSGSSRIGRISWQAEHLAPCCATVRQAQGRLPGMAGAVGGELSAQSELDALLRNIVSSSAIVRASRSMSVRCALVHLPGE